MKEKMTIHRALAELKTIDSRIEKAINEFTPTVIYQEKKITKEHKNLFEENVKSQFQSINDLIIRKAQIKKAIIYSNSITNVKIGEKTMSVADAIFYKTLMGLKFQFLNSIKSKHSGAKAKMNLENEQIERTALDNAKIMLGKQGDDKVKATDDDVKNLVEPFIERNIYKLSDVLNIEKQIEKIELENSEFLLNVDACLSESNATTFIEL